MNYYPQRRPRPFRVLLLLVGLIIFLIYAGMSYWNFLNSPLNKNGQLKAFVVQKGEGVSSIGDRLERGGFIRSSLAFQVSYQFSQQKRIEAGDFKLSPDMSVKEILENFSRGSVDKWTTLIEGWRVEEMAKKLNQELGIKNDEFLSEAKQYEGYLFPDTYLFNPKAKISDIVSTLRNNFDSKFSDELKNKIKQKGLSEEEGVVLASIVEREARSDKVRTEVASVLLKRFKLGMKLDADATVQYAKDSIALKNGRLDKFWQPISRADYSGVVSPYNTYLNNGLPPTPISNPSLSSLKAVANADPSTPYLFYYHDSKGNSYYAKTIEEHNRNIANNR
ncbi:endolytic transglycosylase MltG [Candidatus Daviesbacteria bacterium]|nr:endolytic transglycosylase MltG [Candidatus Daviesbacteria bacterium]